MGTEASSTRALMGSRPLAESLYPAAEKLERSVNMAATDEHWFAAAHAAIRAATLAVEKRLNDFGGPEGYAQGIAEDEPRLLPELEQLEAALARLLVEAWGSRPTGPQPTPEFVERLDRLAADMRKVASAEWALVHEAMNKPGGLD